MSATQTPTLIPTGTWKVDPSHSTLEFGIKHMDIAIVKGRFKELEATLRVTEEDIALDGSVKVASLDTQEPNRDTHLVSPEFFDAERFPEITFHAKRFEPSEDGTFRVVGEITMKGVTREIELEGAFTGADTDPWGKERVGFTLEGSLNRRDFGLSWNQPLPNGGQLLGDEVTLSASFSAVKEG